MVGDLNIIHVQVQCMYVAMVKNLEFLGGRGFTLPQRFFLLHINWYDQQQLCTYPLSTPCTVSLEAFYSYFLEDTNKLYHYMPICLTRRAADAAFILSVNSGSLHRRPFVPCTPLQLSLQGTCWPLRTIFPIILIDDTHKPYTGST